MFPWAPLWLSTFLTNLRCVSKNLIKPKFVSTKQGLLQLFKNESEARFSETQCNVRQGMQY